MAISARKLRIGGATAAAALLVAGGYVLPGLSMPKTQAVNAELTDELLATYVAKDADQDGLPDWQESLYGTDPNVADTDRDGIADGEAVRRGLLTPTALASQLPDEPAGEEDIPGEAPASGSFTDQFARAFFEAYLETSNGQPLTEEAQRELVERLITDFKAKSTQSLFSSYTRVSIRTSTAVSNDAYAASVERVLKSNEVREGEGDPLALMQAFVEKDDASAREKLLVLGNAYKAISQELLAISVPPVFADEHLALVRSFDSLGRATLIVTDYKTDPLGTLGALAIYQPSFAGITDALSGIATELLTAGEPAHGAPGSYIIGAVRYSQSL